MAAGMPPKAVDPDDQTTITWHDPNYPHALNQFSVLHYFELSPFFNRDCNNTIARQQGHDPAVPGALEHAVPQGGLEYVLDLAQPPHLFVIRKQHRKGADAAPGALSPLAFYYVLDKVVYQAPTLHAVLSSRVRRCAWGLHQGFAKLQADLDPLTAQLRARTKLQAEEEARLQKQRQAEEPASGAVAAGTVDQGATAPMATATRVNAADAEQWRRTDNIILSVLAANERASQQVQLEI